jgi:hypothetical protein
MFTRIPRTGSHLRAAARQAAARQRRFAAAPAAVICALLASFVSDLRCLVQLNSSTAPPASWASKN